MNEAKLIDSLFYFPCPEKQKEVDAILKEHPHLLTAHDGRGSTLLHESVASGNRELAKQVLAAGIDVDAVDDFGNTPLFRATTSEMVEFLLARGADLEHLDRMGNTPLMSTCGGLGSDAKRALIAHGADIHAKNGFGLCVIHTARTGAELKLLLEAGVDVNLPDGQGNRPLHYAILEADSWRRRFLVELGARELPNNAGIKPSELIRGQLRYGIATAEVSTARLSAFLTEEGLCWSLDVHAMGLELPDGNYDPYLYSQRIFALEGKRFAHWYDVLDETITWESGYDYDRDEPNAGFCLWSHDEIENAKIAFSKRTQSDFRLRWTGRHEGIELEVDAIATFQGIKVYGKDSIAAKEAMSYYLDPDDFVTRADNFDPALLLFAPV